MTTVPAAMAPAGPHMLPPMPRRQRRWVSVLLVALVFFGGCVTGGGVVLTLIKSRVSAVFDHPEREAARQVAELKKQLNLTPEQARQMETIYTNRISAIVHNGLGQWDLLDQEIQRLLTDEQRQRWQKLHSQRANPWLPKKPPPADNGKKSLPSV